MKYVQIQNYIVNNSVLACTFEIWIIIILIQNLKKILNKNNSGYSSSSLK